MQILKGYHQVDYILERMVKMLFILKGQKYLFQINPKNTRIRIKAYFAWQYLLVKVTVIFKMWIDKGYTFRLATEMDAAEKFDDLVFIEKL
jgi:ribosomal protein L23